jgi:hypothetical protein
MRINIWPFNRDKPISEERKRYNDQIEEIANKQKEHREKPKKDAYDNFINPLNKNAKPCPFCGSSNVDFKYTVSYGHGDSGFSGGCQCINCKAKKGSVGYYGRPETHHIVDAFNQWNDRKN